MPYVLNPTSRWRFSRDASIWASRAVIVLVVAAALASYFWQPVSALAWVADVVGRAYLHFIAGAMAHEGTHGALGRSKRANMWWGRLALLPTTVPFVSFRKTHIAHHKHTNEPELDPDVFLNTPNVWELPFRAVLMPHHWVRWLVRHGRFTRRDLADYVGTYAAYFSVYALIAAQVGVGRFVAGILGAAVLHSFILWFPFAILTHQGYSTGAAEERSHDYRGGVAYLLTFGLALHRVHHLKPNLGWLEMATYIQPVKWREALSFRRDIRRPAHETV
jgi:fatty acid desaturase